MGELWWLRNWQQRELDRQGMMYLWEEGSSIIKKTKLGDKRIMCYSDDCWYLVVAGMVKINLRHVLLGCMKELKTPFKNGRNWKLQAGPSVCERAKPSLPNDEQVSVRCCNTRLKSGIQSVLYHDCFSGQFKLQSTFIRIFLLLKLPTICYVRINKVRSLWA